MRYRWECPACEGIYLLDNLRWPEKIVRRSDVQKLENLRKQAEAKRAEIGFLLDAANPYLKGTGFSVEQKLSKASKQDGTIAEGVKMLALLDTDVKKQGEEMSVLPLPQFG